MVWCAGACAGAARETCAGETAVVVGGGAYGVAGTPNGEGDDNGTGGGWLMIGRTDDGPAAGYLEAFGPTGRDVQTFPIRNRTAPLSSSALGTNTAPALHGLVVFHSGSSSTHNLFAMKKMSLSSHFVFCSC
jgi:hypothetical protein